MPSSAGFTIEILCDGKALKEYTTEVEAKPKTTTCWIASQEGKTFTCRVSYDEDDTYLWGFKMYCDGVLLAQPFTQTTGIRKGLSTMIYKVYDGQNFRELQFSRIKTTDQDDPQQRIDPLFGSISIGVWRVHTKGLYAPVKKLSTNLEALAPAPLPETKKTLIGHHVSLGREIQCQQDQEGGLIAHKLDDSPIWTFILYYRPEAVLRAEGHIPESSHISAMSQSSQSQSGSTKPTTLKRSASQDLNDAVSSDDDEDVVAAKIHVLNQQLDSIRSRKKRKVVKREASPIVIQGGSGEVIEISD